MYLDSPSREESSRRLDEIIGEYDGDLSRAADHLDAKKLLALIPSERERSVVSAYCVGGLALDQIAQGLGFTREWVRQYILHGLRAARAGLRRMDRVTLQPVGTTLKCEPRRTTVCRHEDR